ncbi:MSMEG_1061 family FMN-dependent PPOX-type flavoprotein [Cytobacillus purgationiresistens]|uniref:PPOX class probable FMN-dependent enzyme n=1 Tax=Cytobacillus purgationiresistens TaxID=863449 RepID=A0ABU0AGX1_9BACI|nr:MSMEG_1061 family FMN-dependent PPOX-type flavoprotein [Cytobacillus purgationiresistens]MDQ0270506.1 PPOX class probable FMN-dependent enzyme [Cytobacillus purgationiresistens]
MNHSLFKDIIQSEDELRSLFDQPGKAAANKIINEIDEHCRDFIAKSPMLFLSTAHADGRCDNSPRGDEAGFVHIMDAQHLVIPERPGNRRLDSISNILTNPNVGLLFIIPRLEETLRINGKATIIRDAGILEKMALNGIAPKLGIAVKVEECFIHCAKSFKRSELWNPESWDEKDNLPTPSKMLAAHVKKNTEIQA